MPVFNGLLNYVRENNIPFHMPGHKNNRRKFDELEMIKENLYKIDNTEVPGLDNLHIPEGMILDGEKLASNAYGAGESFFLVNGSTSGVYSMIMGTTKPGDKILMQRNCHRSVYMACFLGDIDAVYINPTVLDGFNIAVSLNVDDVIAEMDRNPDAKAIVLTYPTVYGTCCDLERIVSEAHKRGILVLVDEAHGAHLPFNKKLPKSAMECGADAAVTSMHKTTPALTQTALLNVRKGLDTEGIRFMLRAVQTTSPSYVFMASIDAARYIMETRGEALLDELLINVDEFKNKIKDTGGFNILDSEYIGKSSIHSIDSTRLVIKSQAGGRKLEHILRNEYHIQVEMSDIYNIILICSAGDDRESFERLYTALKEISYKYNNNNIESIPFKVPQYKKAVNLREAYYMPKKKVKLKDSNGLISSEMVVPYPPGIPILLPGEIITYDIIEYIELLKQNGIPLNGISDSAAEYIDTAAI